MATAERYATIIKDNEGREVVSSISLMEGTTPEIRKDSTAKVVKVPDGVVIGMVKGGKHGSVAGFGWLPDHPNAKATSFEEGRRYDAALDKVRATPAGKGA